MRLFNNIYHRSCVQVLKVEPTSVANLRSKSVSIAIASSVASSVPNAGISLVLLDPRVGYLETADTVRVKQEPAAGWGSSEFKHVCVRTGDSRWL